MKKLILSAIALSVILFSCSKEEAPKSVNNVNSFVPMEANSLMVWYDNGKIPGKEGLDYGCEGSGGNCLPEVPVYGIVNPDIIVDVVGVINSGNVNDIQNSFSNNETELGQVIPEGLVSGVISGQYEVTNRGVFGQNSNAYLQFTENGQLIQVTPLQE